MVMRNYATLSRSGAITKQSYKTFADLPNFRA